MDHLIIFLRIGLAAIILLILFWNWQNRLAHSKRKQDPSTPRHMNPKSERDCPLCLHEHATPPAYPATSKPIVPYSEIKGKGGPRKKVPTQWYFCPHPDCIYYLITDACVHALIGYGSHGKYERIQDLFCQACKHKFTIRRNTILYCLHTLSTTVAQILHLSAYGCDISVLAEIYHKQDCTIRGWLMRGGHFAHKFHDRYFQDLRLPHVQLDELFAQVKRAPYDVWVWLAMDAKTKLIPVVKIGERTQDTAYAVVHELKARLHPDCVPVFSTDGLKHYFYALTAHFGEWVWDSAANKRVWMILPAFLYAQVVKTQSRFRLKSVEHRYLWGTPQKYYERLQAVGLSGYINTSFVERVNLTFRRHVSKLMRRTWSSAQYIPELDEHIFWWLAVYHFVRPHESLRIPLSQPMARRGRQIPRRFTKVTPAQAAGLTSRQWSVYDLICFPLP